MCQLNQQLTINFYLEPEYSFENFIRTPSTEVAYSAALLVAAKPGNIYNPLFIFGGEGVGKTHLLMAIGNETRLKTEGIEIVYLNSKSILASQERTRNEFDTVSLVKQYSDIDVLIIDDIDMILRKQNLDEKVFHLYNHLIQKGKQLIFASCTPPHQLDLTDLNLKSRLKSGLTVKIGNMNDKDKRKVIKKLSKDFEMLIPGNVINYILNFAPRDFESLQKIISRLNQASLETKKRITIPFVKNIFKKNGV